MHKNVCKHCGKEFQDYSPRKFCSIDCYLAYRRKQAIADKIKQLQTLARVQNTKRGQT